MSFLSQHRSDSYRKMVEDFIVMYKHEPCLWHIKNRDYYDKGKRNAALDRLLEKCREVEPAAVREDVSKKINSLRTTYNKERQRVKDAELAGEARVPKLWYYSLMTFLDDKDRPEVPDDYHEELEAEETEEMDLKEEYVEIDDNSVAIENTRLSIEQSDTEDPILTVKPLRSKKRKITYEYNDTVQSEDGHSLRADPGASRSRRPRDGDTGDRHDFFSKYIACKMRDLPRQQLLLAEKLISEVLFEAECSNLTMKHKLTKE